MKRWIAGLIFYVLGLPAGVSAQVVDHTSYPLFAQMPPEVLAQALATRFEMADASVGENVYSGLVICLPSAMASAPNWCRSVRAGLPPETWTPMTPTVVYNTVPGQDGTINPMTGCVGNNGQWQGMLPCWRSWIRAHLADHDTVAMFPNYNYGSVASMPTSYTQLSGDYDAYDQLNFELELNAQGKRMVWFGASIAKDQGAMSSTLAAYNAAARAFAQAHSSTVFLDVGDIESHCADGSLAVNASGYPIQCLDWGSETNGGHLTYGWGKIRMAKYVLIAVALSNGWNPNGPPPPDTIPPIITKALSGGIWTITISDNVGINSVDPITARDAAGNSTTVTIP